LCTCTAAPFVDLDGFTQSIAYYKELEVPWPRVSILSAAMTRRLHDTFTPDELRDVPFLNQCKTSRKEKAIAGNTLHISRDKLGGKKTAEGEYESDTQDTIACMSGFYVKLLDQSIELISPCRACEKYPLGYRLWAKTTFTDVEDYRKKLEELIETHMPTTVTNDMLLGFREDLKLEPQQDSIILKSYHQSHHITGSPFWPNLGRLIEEKRYTYEEISKILMQQGAPVFSIPIMVRRLFDQGFLDETLIGTQAVA